MKARNIRHRIKQDLALLAEADERDMDFVRCIALRRAKDVGRAKDQTGSEPARCLAHEIATTDHAGFVIHAITTF